MKVWPAVEMVWKRWVPKELARARDAEVRKSLQLLSVSLPE